MIHWLKAAAVAVIAILAPIHSVMLTTGILIFADLLLGVIAAYKRKETITSAALRRTVTKILVYQTAIVTGFLCEKFLLSGSIPVVKLAAGAIGLVEVKSIMENLNEINGSPIFNSLLSALGSKNDSPPK